MNTNLNRLDSSKRIIRRRGDHAYTVNGEKFRENYSKLFFNDNTRRVRKQLIIKYHLLITQFDKSIRPIKRENMRIISTYFNSFADQESLILSALKKLMIQSIVNHDEDVKSLSK